MWKYNLPRQAIRKLHHPTSLRLFYDEKESEILYFWVQARKLEKLQICRGAQCFPRTWQHHVEHRHRERWTCWRRTTELARRIKRISVWREKILLPVLHFIKNPGIQPKQYSNVKDASDKWLRTWEKCTPSVRPHHALCDRQPDEGEQRAQTQSGKVKEERQGTDAKRKGAYYKTRVE